jgi:general stress protein CsbA
MTSQAVTPRGTSRVELDALADSCRAASGDLLATAAHLERSCQRATTVAAIGLLALCASVVLVAVRFLAWGVVSQAIATVDSIALMAGGVWLDRIDRRSRAEIAAVRRTAERARGAAALLASGHDAKAVHQTPENVLSQAIESVDSIALTAGGIWLEKVDKRSNAEIVAPRRAAEPPRPSLPAGGPGPSAINRARATPPVLPAPPTPAPASPTPQVPPVSSRRVGLGDPHGGTPVR